MGSLPLAVAREILDNNDFPEPQSRDSKLQEFMESAKANIRSEAEHTFSAIKQKFGLQKTLLQNLTKNHSKINAMVPLNNLYLARGHSRSTFHTPNIGSQGFAKPKTAV